VELLNLHNLSVELGGTRIRRTHAALREDGLPPFIGLNGSGKTTLLRAVLKEVPYSGAHRVSCGHDHSHPDRATSATCRKAPVSTPTCR